MEVEGWARCAEEHDYLAHPDPRSPAFVTVAARYGRSLRAGASLLRFRLSSAQSQSKRNNFRSLVLFAVIRDVLLSERNAKLDHSGTWREDDVLLDDSRADRT
jgi:hypothetical protein